MRAVTLENNLMHSHVAYLHAVGALPSPTDLHSGPIHQNGIVFSSEDQIHSQIIELGWAFFPRYEGCLEKWLKDQDVKLARGFEIKDWLKNHHVSIPSKYSKGLDLYRKIRNALHHDDGASFDGNPETEIHLLPDHMANFIELFFWIGRQVDQVNVAKRI